MEPKVKRPEPDEELDWSALFGETPGASAAEARLARFEDRVRMAEKQARISADASSQARAWAEMSDRIARHARVVSVLCAVAVALMAASIIAWRLA